MSVQPDCGYRPGKGIYEVCMLDTGMKEKRSKGYSGTTPAHKTLTALRGRYTCSCSCLSDYHCLLIRTFPAGYALSPSPCSLSHACGRSTHHSIHSHSAMEPDLVRILIRQRQHHTFCAPSCLSHLLLPAQNSTHADLQAAYCIPEYMRPLECRFAAPCPPLGLLDASGHGRGRGHEEVVQHVGQQRGHFADRPTPNVAVQHRRQRHVALDHLASHRVGKEREA